DDVHHSRSDASGGVGGVDSGASVALRRDCRASATTMTTTRPPTIAKKAMTQDSTPWSAPAAPPEPEPAPAGGGVPTGAAATPPPAGEAPGAAPDPADQPAGTGPGAAGCGPYRVGALPLTLASQAAPKSVASTPRAALNASSSVRPSAYERMSFTSAS